MQTNSETESTQTCRRCSGNGEIRMYAHRLAGVCFRCWGSGIELTPAERARRKRARALPEARKAVEMAQSDIAEWLEVLAHRKARAVKRADRMVARGRAADRAAAFAAMLAQPRNVNVEQVKNARWALQSARQRLAENTAKLNQLQGL